MKTLTSIIAVALLAFSLGSCTTTMPLTATGNTLGSRVGQSEAVMLFGLPNGDYSIATAAKNGGISKISTVDVKFDWWIFGITYTTIVTGE
jgi:hypothetical protein